MINEILFMNGYGLYVWSAFLFTLISFTTLYLIIKVQYVKERNKFVGRAGLLTKNLDDVTEVELAFAVMPECWRQGYGYEMSKSILNIAFNTLNFKEIICFALPENNASLSLMQKLGFRYEKEIVHAGFPHASYRLISEN